MYRFWGSIGQFFWKIQVFPIVLKIRSWWFLSILVTIMAITISYYDVLRAGVAQSSRDWCESLDAVLFFTQKEFKVARTSPKNRESLEVLGWLYLSSLTNFVLFSVRARSIWSPQRRTIFCKSSCSLQEYRFFDRLDY